MATHDMDMDELLDSVELKNRIVDGPVMLTRNSRQVIWGPGEVKRMPRKLAEWFRQKSLYQFHPGDHNEGISPKWQYKLAIVGDASQDMSQLTRAHVLEVKELLDVANMPELRRVDKDGHLMRRVYIDPRSTGAMSTSDNQRRVEEQVMQAVSKDIVSDAAGKIADAAQHASESEIEDAVADLTGVAVSA